MEPGYEFPLLSPEEKPDDDEEIDLELVEERENDSDEIDDTENEDATTP